MSSYLQIRTIYMVVLIISVVFLSWVLFFMNNRLRRAMAGTLEENQKQTSELQYQMETAKASAAAKSNFLSRMSHEIRTPLNAIIGMAQIARNTKDTDKLTDCMNKMESSSKHLLGIINDILDFSKIESGNLTFEEKLFSLSHEIDFVTSMFKTKTAEKNLTLRVEISIEHDGIVTDVLRLNQVLINLLSNAVKFTDAGGTIELTAEELVHLNGESAYRFTVRDNGVGIEPDQAKKLFTPFTQANAGVSRIYGGTGLGLAISQNIVRRMGGGIELETAPGKGSSFCFTIRVPSVEHAAEETAEAPPAAAPEKLRGKRVLIVDDIDINREIVEVMLEDTGLAIETAVNGKEALDAFCGAEHYWYDIILMDMQMPVMDGCAAAAEIRDSGRPDSADVKIIAMTANVLPEDVERAYSAGMDAYLPKPIDMDALFRSMEDLL